MNAVSTGNVGAQAAAVDALGTMAASPDTLAALLGALENRSALVRQSAAEALTRLAAQPAIDGVPSPGPEAAAALLDLLQSDDAPLVRRAAALALGHLGDPAARDALEASQTDSYEDPLVRDAAGEALGRLRRLEPAQEAALPDNSVEQPVEEEYHSESLGRFPVEQRMPERSEQSQPPSGQPLGRDCRLPNRHFREVWGEPMACANDRPGLY